MKLAGQWTIESDYKCSSLHTIGKMLDKSFSDVQIGGKVMNVISKQLATKELDKVWI